MGEGAQKLLLMGAGGSGKTSMRSIIFANFVARDTTKFASTVAVDRTNVKFLGNHVHLWDCGGQMRYVKSYFTTERENIFSNVNVLIFVVDVKSVKMDEDLADYGETVQNLAQFSPGAKLFCLVHKMDLVSKEERDKTFAQMSQHLATLSGTFKVQCFQTSIWEETLYKAWSSIVETLIPNHDLIHKHLSHFMSVSEAEEVVLFEKSTFLDIAHSTHDRSKSLYTDIHRFERISNIIKMFKLSCMKSGSHLQSMRVNSDDFDAFLDEFTSNTYVLVIVRDPEVQTAAMLLNIKNARGHFETLLKLSLR